MPSEGACREWRQCVALWDIKGDSAVSIQHIDDIGVSIADEYVLGELQKGQGYI